MTRPGGSNRPPDSESHAVPQHCPRVSEARVTTPPRIRNAESRAGGARQPRCLYVQCGAQQGKLASAAGPRRGPEPWPDRLWGLGCLLAGEDRSNRSEPSPAPMSSPPGSLIAGAPGSGGVLRPQQGGLQPEHRTEPGKGGSKAKKQQASVPVAPLLASAGGCWPCPTSVQTLVYGNLGPGELGATRAAASGLSPESCRDLTRERWGEGRTGRDPSLPEASSALHRGLGRRGRTLPARR